ncbi:hypothetical protein BJV74DRAFT_130214 [Russula compacta]|nr:hypothetical protein BJV74DRAFT_130214 [Russula compacta]
MESLAMRCPLRALIILLAPQTGGKLPSGDATMPPTHSVGDVMRDVRQPEIILPFPSDGVRLSQRRTELADRPPYDKGRDKPRRSASASATTRRCHVGACSNVRKINWSTVNAAKLIRQLFSWPKESQLQLQKLRSAIEKQS